MACNEAPRLRKQPLLYMNPDFSTPELHASIGEQAIFSRTRFVLLETSHPGNVGAAARALKTMGFGRLILVNPRVAEVHRHPDAIAMASGADDVLAAAEVVSDLDEALGGAAYSVALTARLREFGPQRQSPRKVAYQATQLMHLPDVELALLFGNERYGLPNSAVERCQMVTHIPANPAYSSLNLAQAVQLMAYELRAAHLMEVEEGEEEWTGTAKVAAHAAKKTQDAIGFVGVPASGAQIEGMFAHLEQALTVIGFLDPASPKKLMPRLRRLLGRAQLETEEVNILRGIARKILDHRRS